MAVIGIDNWSDLGGGVAFWNVVEGKAGLGDITNCSLITDDVVGGNLIVSFDFPTHLVIPFMPNPPSWQSGTARASMRIEQVSAPGGPGGC
jgi:hypothetical protein